MSRTSEPNFFRSLVSIGVLVLLFVGLFFVAKSIFQILAWLAIPMIIAALVINHTSVTSYFKWLWRTINQKPLLGVLAVLITIFGYPIVSGFLLMRAVVSKRIKGAFPDDDSPEKESKRIGEYIGYEEVAEDKYIPEELPRIDPIEQPQKNSSYDELFD